jgi:RNA polymerase sigma-70 factor (ECF subfamily)
MVSEQLLVRARGGDGDAFRDLVQPHRRELQVHCYRILGSVQDAEDMLQETLVAAWRGLDGYQGRASVRTWLYRIATNRCLNALRDGDRRPATVPLPAVPLPEPTRRRAEPIWLQPYPDELLAGVPDAAPGPEARYESREAVSLAFMTAVQGLPPRQRAVLVLRDVLGYRTAEVAEMLGTTEASVNSALRRAREGLTGMVPGSGGSATPGERELVARFVDAIERGDVPAVVALLTDDVWMTMPPTPFEYQGHAAIGEFLATVALRGGRRRYRLLPTGANGQPAFGCYVYDDGEPVGHAHGFMVLTLRGTGVCAVTRFVDNSALPYFGLPRTLPVVR